MLADRGVFIGRSSVMPPIPVRALMSTETECLTLVAGSLKLTLQSAAQELLKELSQLAPALPGPSGIFNAYGRVYLDGSHLEFAAAECSDPFQLVQCIEAQQLLVARAVGNLRHRGIEITLANCNHSGLLTDDAPTWGSHGNYLVGEHPSQLADRLLPFLVTRVYAGAGGVHWPSGQFLAGVRLNFLTLDCGGDTMHRRAIHSTSRDEPLTSQPQRYGWRYHTVLGDGLRSHFSLLLRFGVTSLVLQAITAMPDGLRRLPVPSDQAWRPSFWIQALRRFNGLTRDEAGLHSAPIAIEVQRVYLQLVDRYVQSLSAPPAWMRQVVTIWESTLNALARRDHDWLAARLDPWIKFQLIAAYLIQHNRRWGELACDPDLAAAVTLLNQRYHTFTAADSPFVRLEQAGLLTHRVGPIVCPGQELDPFVPEYGTRATTRARFIQQQRGDTSLSVNWDGITGPEQQWLLDDPFATDVEIRG